jgi:hypothetical protein
MIRDLGTLDNGYARSCEKCVMANESFCEDNYRWLFRRVDYADK